jgi:uncharacterized protein (TIGR02246 family)
MIRIFVLLAFMLVLQPAAAEPMPAATPESIPEKFVQAWNSHDQQAFASLFTEDAYWVPMAHVRLHRRERIVDDLAHAHRTWAGNTTMSARDVVVRHLGGDTAIALFAAPFVGDDGKPLSTGSVLLMVIVKQGDGWRIAAGQLTKIDRQPSTVPKKLACRVDSMHRHSLPRFARSRVCPLRARPRFARWKRKRKEASIDQPEACIACRIPSVVC